MEEEHRDKTQSYLRQRMNGTGGDMPTGYRPCPFCHAVIAWQSERCPSCGRVLVERVGSGPLQKPPRDPRSLNRTSWWSASVRSVLARVRQAVQRIVRPTVTGISSGRGGSWATASRGTSWSVFQPARRSAHSRWLRSIPATTERERQILLIASAVMVLFLLISLVIR
jgi:hypothetical protein